MEILLVLGLLALLGFLGVSTASILGDGLERADETFWTAIQEARGEAIRRQKTVALRLTDGGRKLTWETESGPGAAFLPAGTGVEFMSLGMPWLETSFGTAVPPRQSSPVLRFYRDGTCDGARVRAAGPRGVVAEWWVDPWTCGRVVGRGREG